MTPIGLVARYDLTRKASDDLTRIYADGVRTFGRAQAAAYHASLRRMFETLARFPELARERTELDPPVRYDAHGRRLIVYIVTDQGIVVVRIRHGHEDRRDPD